MKFFLFLVFSFTCGIVMAKEVYFNYYESGDLYICMIDDQNDQTINCINSTLAKKSGQNHQGSYPGGSTQIYTGDSIHLESHGQTGGTQSINCYGPNC